jgi:trimeric autotransporter adhesin
VVDLSLLKTKNYQIMKKLFVLIMLLSLEISNTKAQIINTVVGNGYEAGFGGGYSGDGGPATDAEFNSPVSIAFDKNHNLYIADRNNHVVRMVNTAGIVSTVAGNGHNGLSGDGGPATAAELEDDVGVLVDSLGNLYISEDAIAFRLRKVNTAGIINTIAGNGIGGYSGDGGPATAAEISATCFMTMDKKGDLFFTDAENNVIRKIDTVGIITTIAGNYFYGYGYSGDGGPATAAEMYTPEGIAFDEHGNLYITDCNNYVIRKVDTSGIITTIAGNHHYGYSGDGGPATLAELYQPDGIVIDASGNIYFADELNNVIRRIDGSGIITTVAGNGVQGYTGDGGPATAAEMLLVSVVIFDSTGNMYMADEGNNVIREVTGVTTGIYQSSAYQFSVFPNPTSQNLILIFNKQIIGLATLSIMDVTGREVMKEECKMNNEKYTVDVSTLPDGMYFLTIKNQDIQLTQKFIKY